MSEYIENYGFTKTEIKSRGHRKSQSEMKWIGKYDGNIANLHLNVNNNGKQEYINMKLDNDDLIHMLGIQPVNMPLETRLTNDFPDKPLTLERIFKKSRKHKNKRKNKSRKHKQHKKRKTYKQFH
jgi:hypothetical protein